MKPTHIKTLLAALTIEGLLALVFLFVNPSMQRNTLLWGYSAARLMAGILTLLMLAPLVWLCLRAFLDQQFLHRQTFLLGEILRRDSNLLTLTTLVIFFLATLSGFSITFSSPLGDYFSTLRDLKTRLLPLILWMMAGLLQVLLVLLLNFRADYARRGFVKWGQVFHILLIPVMLLLTITHWIILFLRLDVFTVIPGWFWGFHEKETGGREFYFIFVLLLMLLVVEIALRKPVAFRRNLVFLMVAGYGLQVSFGFIEGQGFESLRQKYANSTHNVYALHAADNPDMLRALTDYESIYGRQQFLETKPPGTLFFYNLTQKLSAPMCPQGSFDERFYCLTLFAAHVYPLISFLVVILIVALCRRLVIAQESAILPGILYITLPNVLLMALFLDQVLYPLLFVLSPLLALLAAQKRSGWLALVCGMVVYGSLYFSFSLLAILPLSLLIIGLYSLWLDWHNLSITDLQQLLHCKRAFPLFKGALRLSLGFFAGLAFAFALFALILNYDVVARYEHAMEFHRYADFVQRIGNTGEAAEQAVKSPPPALVIRAFFLNNIEFAAWAGFPVALLAFYGSVRTICRVIRRNISAMEVVFTAFLITMAAMNVFGQTLGEVGRLWLFLTPMLAIFGGVELFYQFGRKRLPVYLVIVLQLVTVMLTFKYQDFFR